MPCGKGSRLGKSWGLDHAGDAGFRDLEPSFADYYWQNYEEWNLLPRQHMCWYIHLAEPAGFGLDFEWVPFPLSLGGIIVVGTSVFLPDVRSDG